MELRHVLNVLRRQVWMIVQVLLLAAVASGLLSNLRTPVYRASASVLLRPNDPAEQLNPANGQRTVSDPDRYVVAQKSIVRSEAVARAAASSLKDVSPVDVERRLSVEQGGRSDILRISAEDTDPVRARDIANAVVKAFIENRRASAVAGLKQAADEIEGKLLPLQRQIAQLDAQIGDGATTPGATATPQGPTPPGSPPAAPAPAPAPVLDPGGQPTTKEALKAARYAAAVQYETLFARQQELLVDITLKRGEAELIAEATTPHTPVRPRPVRDTILGAVAGLFLGVGLGLLREHLQDRVRSAQEVERLSGLPVLAQLPYDDESGRTGAEVTAITRPNAPLTEAVRALRTSILYMATDGPLKVLLVTSAVPGEGKSFVAANLAAAYARAGYRTILISADLRRSGTAELFGVSPSAPGLTNVVTQVFASEGAHANGSSGSNGSNGANGASGSSLPGNTLTLSLQATIETQDPLLTYLPSGPTPPNPSELLGSKRMREVLEELSASAEIVVIDTPPLLPVTDAAVLAASADGVVLVAAIGETERESLKRATAVLQGTRARVLGMVVNKVPKREGSYDYSYYGASPKDERRAGRRRSVQARSAGKERRRRGHGRNNEGGDKDDGSVKHGGGGNAGGSGKDGGSGGGGGGAREGSPPTDADAPDRRAAGERIDP